MNDELEFLDDELDLTQNPTPSKNEPWKILIVDDEPSVHELSKLSLSTIAFQNRPLQLFHAFDSQEALKILKEEEQIALALVDVVMETEEAGIQLVKTIRNELENNSIRLVLRTGQPGQAPEELVITELDIHDYKNKTELTHLKLKTLIYSTLRSFRDIRALEQSRLGLEKILNGLNQIYHTSSFSLLASGILDQLTHLLHFKEPAYFAIPSKVTQGDYLILAHSKDSLHHFKMVNEKDIPPQEIQLIQKAQESQESIYTEGVYLGYYGTSEQSSFIHLPCDEEPDKNQKYLLHVFASNMTLAFDALNLKEEIRESQKEIVSLLGEAVEKRSKETGGHVKRVAAISHYLATLKGLSPDIAEMIRLASPLHDVGKIGIPDAVLNKPGRLTAEEFELMKQHAKIGYEMLYNSDNDVLKVASKISLEHHEKWNGKGYPNQLKGEEISIEGRITALADVFDALGSKRCYKDPWPTSKIIALLKEERGEQFDPDLVDLFLNNLDTIAKYREIYPD